MGGLENGNFPLLYVVKVSLRAVQKSLRTPLRNIKMAPYLNSYQKIVTLRTKNWWENEII